VAADVQATSDCFLPKNMEITPSRWCRSGSVIARRRAARLRIESVGSGPDAPGVPHLTPWSSVIVRIS